MARLKDRKDDTIMLAIVDELKKRGSMSLSRPYSLRR